MLVLRIHKFSGLLILSSRLYLSRTSLGEFLNLHRVYLQLVHIGCTEDQCPSLGLLETYRTKGVPNFASLVYLPRPRVRAYSPLFTLRCSLCLLPLPPLLSPLERFPARDGGQFAGGRARCDTGWRWDDAPRFGGVEEWLVQGAHDATQTREECILQQNGQILENLLCCRFFAFGGHDLC